MKSPTENSVLPLLAVNFRREIVTRLKLVSVRCRGQHAPHPALPGRDGCVDAASTDFGTHFQPEIIPCN